jgi:large subunit ribosomal protein L10
MECSQVDRAAKQELVTTLHDVFKDTGVIVVAHYAGMTVAQMTDFRKRMREAGGTVKVAKNTLAVLALKETDSQGISDLFKGQTCIAYSSDPMVAARIAVKYSRENDKLVILMNFTATTEAACSTGVNASHSGTAKYSKPKVRLKRRPAAQP